MIVGELPDADGHFVTYRWTPPGDLLARAGEQLWPGEGDVDENGELKDADAPELLPPAGSGVIGRVNINNSMSPTVVASIAVRRDTRPAQCLPGSTDWDLLSENHKVVGWSRAINDSGQICGEH